MTKIVVMLMPWGRVGSNLVNGVISSSKLMTVWNEPLTGVQTRVVAAGGTLEDVAHEQEAWIDDNLVHLEKDVFINIAANSISDPSAVGRKLDSLGSKYFVLDRQDDAATAISALRTEAWVREGIEKGEHRTWSIPKGQSHDFKPIISPERFLAALKIINSGRENIAIMTNERHVNTFFYEDLIRDSKKVLDNIVEMCELPGFIYKIATSKFGSEILSNMVSNDEELKSIIIQKNVKTKLKM